MLSDYREGPTQQVIPACVVNGVSTGASNSEAAATDVRFSFRVRPTTYSSQAGVVRAFLTRYRRSIQVSSSRSSQADLDEFCGAAGA